jgi:hypothetical protein
VAAQAALDDGVVLVVGGEAGVGQGPAAGLGERVGAGVEEVLAGDRGEVRGLQAVALGVGVGDAGEHRGPQEAVALALVTGVRGGGHVARGLLAGDVALLLDAEDEHAVVAAGLDVGHGGEHGEAARGARALVARGGHAPQRGLGGGRHGAEVGLAREQLAERVADVDRGDVGEVERGVGEGGVEGVTGEVGEVAAVLREAPGEVALGAAEDVDWAGHAGRP